MLKNSLTKTNLIIGTLSLFLALSPVAFAADKLRLNTPLLIVPGFELSAILILDSRFSVPGDVISNSKLDKVNT